MVYRSSLLYGRGGEGEGEGRGGGGEGRGGEGRGGEGRGGEGRGGEGRGGGNKFYKRGSNQHDITYRKADSSRKAVKWDLL